MITTLIILLVVFQLKHFVADYLLQTKYMLGKFKDANWHTPLLAHVGVHAAITFGIVTWFGFTCHQHYSSYILERAFAMAMFDGSVHFVMDRVKASPKLLGRFKPLTAETYKDASPEKIRSNTFFWWALGFDQLIHHLTHYAIIAWLLFHMAR
jgi:hypothetical protein